jgi:hypothetical protein
MAGCIQSSFSILELRRHCDWKASLGNHPSSSVLIQHTVTMSSDNIKAIKKKFWSMLKHLFIRGKKKSYKHTRLGIFSLLDQPVLVTQPETHIKYHSSKVFKVWCCNVLVKPCRPAALQRLRRPYIPLYNRTACTLHYLSVSNIGVWCMGCLEGTPVIYTSPCRCEPNVIKWNCEWTAAQQTAAAIYQLGQHTRRVLVQSITRDMKFISSPFQTAGSFW